MAGHKDGLLMAGGMEIEHSGLWKEKPLRLQVVPWHVFIYILQISLWFWGTVMCRSFKSRQSKLHCGSMRLKITMACALLLAEDSFVKFTSSEHYQMTFGYRKKVSPVFTNQQPCISSGFILSAMSSIYFYCKLPQIYFRMWKEY